MAADRRIATWRQRPGAFAIHDPGARHISVASLD
jgi:hypothetical protein